MNLSDITNLISSLRAQTAKDSITPNGLGAILQRIVDAISSMSGIDVEDENAILQRLSAAESNASTALQAAQSAQAGAANNVIDSFTSDQEEDEVSLSLKQHGYNAKQVVLPVASSTGAGIMTATDKSHLDTAYGKRISQMSAPSSESVVTLTITFGDGTTKSVTFVGATAGTGGKAGLMTKEQADQLAALVAAGPAESVRDDAGYLKQQYAAPIILRNVTDTVFDDLAIGDVYYDTGHLFYHTEDQSGDPDIGAPSRKVIYYCLADQTLYRWTGSRFVQAVSISSGDVTVPTKLSDLINDMGFLTAHQSLKTINGQTITGTGNITIDGAAELKDASNHIKQSMATPVVLRNVTATVFDDLNEGDTYFDAGHLFYHTEGSSGDIDLGTPSKRLIYFSIANSNFYRWTGSSFTQIAAGGSSSEILALNGVSTNQDGTIVFTDTAGNTYTVNLNHTHENMAKLVVCEESDLPSTLDNSTIYAITDSGETEIEKLIIRGMEFAGGGGTPSTDPRIVTPIGTQLDFNGESTKTVTVKALNLSEALTIAVTGMTANLQTISASDAENGVQLTLTKGQNFSTGTLRIYSTEVDKSWTVIDSQVTVQYLTAIKTTGTQYFDLGYTPNPDTKFEFDVKFEKNNITDTTTAANNCCPFLSAPEASGKFFIFQTGYGNMELYSLMAYTNTTNPYSKSNYGNEATFCNRGTMEYENGSLAFLGRTQSPDTMAHTAGGTLLLGYGTNKSRIFDVFNMYVYRLKIYEGSTLLHDFKPVTYQGTPGLWDDVNCTFISSASGVDPIEVE